jgi:hypothetical protein
MFQQTLLEGVLQYAGYMKSLGSSRLKRLIKRSRFECYYLPWTVLGPRVPRVKLNMVKVATACDSSHFLPAVELLKSLEIWQPNWKVSLWDLGLSEVELSFLSSKFPDVKLSRFPFEEYPDYFSMKNLAGQFAWKPTLLRSEAEGWPGILIWMDAGDRVISNSTSMIKIVCRHGFYSPFSAGTVGQWTHQDTLKALQVPSGLLKQRNLNGALLAWDLTDAKSMNLLNTWADAAQDPNVICPAGSNLTNHRQDQAVLSCLAHLAGYQVPSLLQTLNSGLGIAIHADNVIGLETMVEAQRAGIDLNENDIL